MLITFFNIKGIVHFDFTPQGQRVNQAYYLYAEILKWLHEAVPGKRPKLWPKDWILHHDNTPTLKTHSVRSSSFQHKNRQLKWNTHPIPLIWL